ncbi:CPBP family intramembrane glutamic endopeptidase [Massilia sp. TWP1-3-3]|uniref:CPBP family intramembrane glutamic endopeptidase n=1 Tax=Massilia sp. TWP1-3-3 TaxID=2804573 RepID=UPI003CE8ED37
MATWAITWLLLMALRCRSARRTGFLLDALLVALGILMVVQGAAAPALAPAWRALPAYLLGSLLVFALSVCMTAAAPRAYLASVLTGLGHAGAPRHAQLARRALLVALYEEALWRVVLQTALCACIGSPAALFAVAAAFTHWHRHRTAASWPRTLELFFFSLILGLLYLYTGDPLAAILPHAIRNYLIGLSGYRSEKV